MDSIEYVRKKAKDLSDEQLDYIINYISSTTKHPPWYFELEQMFVAPTPLWTTFFINHVDDKDRFEFCAWIFGRVRHSGNFRMLNGNIWLDNHPIIYGDVIYPHIQVNAYTIRSNIIRFIVNGGCDQNATVLKISNGHLVPDYS